MSEPIKQSDYAQPSETVTIRKEEYDELVSASKFLSALEAAGVDNWDGYDFAREIFEENN